MEKWRVKLEAGNSEAAWNLFIERYRPLILAAIRRTLGDDDDIDDVFAELCAHLSANKMARPARHSDSGRARFSTWLVTVVQHETIDWLRHRDGRRRVTAPAGLTAIQQQIFDRIVCERRSHVEAYEYMIQRWGLDLSFAAFMKAVATTYEHLEQARGKTVASYFPGPPHPLGVAELHPHDALVMSESAARLGEVLATLPADERLAVQLFVVDELPAAAVARAVGWPNAKAVYNRVHRSLARLRRELEQRGLKPDAD